MNLRTCLLAGLLLLGSLSLAQAQQPRYYTPPGGSPLPRELDYFRRDVGVLDQYNTFVAPRRRLERNLQALQAQDVAIARSTQKGLANIKDSIAAPTGTGATYMNYSHYYNRR